MTNEKVVQTDVDRLLALLEEKKQIPLDEAARLIHLPVKTVESLATLLEEEDMLHISYKFTTPFLNYGPPKAVFGEKEKSKKTVADELIITKEEAAAIKKREPLPLKATIREAAGPPQLPSSPAEPPSAAPVPLSETAKPAMVLPDELEQLIALAND